MNVENNSYTIGVRKFLLEILLKTKYESDDEFQKMITDPSEMN